MNPTMFEISVAIFMVSVSVAIVVWFQRYLAAASAKRMLRMMTRVGLDPGAFIGHGDPRTEDILKEVRYQCRKCMAEDFCDRWIAGKAKGDNTFCPNARTFGILIRTTGHTG